MWLKKVARPYVMNINQIKPKFCSYNFKPKNCGKALIKSPNPTILNIHTKGMAKRHLFFNATTAMMARMAVVKSRSPTVVKNSVGKPP